MIALPRIGRPMIARIVSSLVLAPIALLAIHVGPPASDGLLLAAAAVMAWEWGRVCGRRRRPGAVEAVVIAGCVAALVAGALLGFAAGVAVAAGGALLAMLAAARDPRRDAGPANGRRGGAAWFGFGVLYVAVPLLALQWLRTLELPDAAGLSGDSLGEQTGRLLLFWLLGLVWATDVGAFFVGRSLRGPKLWPRISPNKTWSGMVGGLAAAGLVGAAFATALASALLWPAVAASLLLSLVSQAGDFFESGIKRHFGAKDASELIPGHGGLLDRLDGLLAATLVLAFLAWLGKSPLQ